MAKPLLGELYVDLARTSREHPLRFIGEGAEHYYFEDPNTLGHRILKTRYDKDVIPYTEPLIALDTGTRWARTRHDHSGQIAEIIIPPYTWEGETYVTYAVIVNGDPKPRTKTENDFRRVFGRNLNRNI